MGLRFRRSVKISKGIRLNFGKTGTSFSFGTKGLRYTINSSGKRTTSVGISGTGLSYVSTLGGKNKRAFGNKRRKSSSLSIKAQQQAYAKKKKGRRI